MKDDTKRHQAEVRYWIGLRAERGKQWLREILMSIEKRRGKVAANQLREDISTQWTRGNRGVWGDWK